MTNESAWLINANVIFSCSTRKMLCVEQRNRKADRNFILTFWRKAEISWMMLHFFWFCYQGYEKSTGCLDGLKPNSVARKLESSFISYDFDWFITWYFCRCIVYVLWMDQRIFCSLLRFNIIKRVSEYLRLDWKGVKWSRLAFRTFVNECWPSYKNLKS